ncbi:MAG TPA: ABC transporter ATP-binding protein [Nocardioidaceae bacterium]|nr:ABC transporter ATP-binding protein [Nocardioidaceae bacterium]
MPALAATEVRLSYADRTVVHQASLSLEEGQVTALVGPNGSGKSTLLRGVARLHEPDSGALHVGEVAAATLSRREFAQRVTLLSQQRPVPAGVPVREVVEYGRHPYRGRWRQHDVDGTAAVAWAMAVTGVEHMAERGVDELSGGELQRVWLACCLAQRTDVLLLDEPTNHLDLRYQVEILDLVRELADEHGVAVGVVLHDLNQALDIADRIVLMHEGRVLATGAPRDVLTPERVRHAYGIPVTVTSEPGTGRLTLRPVGRHSSRLPQPA